MKSKRTKSDKKVGATSAKLKKYALLALKSFDDMLHKPKENVDIFIWLCIFIMICLFGPIISPTAYYRSVGLLVVGEIIYGFFTLLLLLCTIVFHRKSILHWVASVLFIGHYVSLIDVGADWNKQFGLFYMGITAIYFCSILSFLSAKEVNRKGGKYDTILLAVGMASLLIGVILKNGEYQYYKRLIVAGIALIYLYAISRAILRAFFSKDTTKVTLLQTMLYVVVYILLIIGVPFLLKYAGVKDDIVKNIITPIYAAAIGGILTLSGVAWTIKHADRQRKEDERKNLQPLFNFVNRNLYQKVDGRKLTFIYGGALINTDENNDLQKSPTEIYIESFDMENTSKTEFFVCGIYINDIFYKTQAKELIKKEHTIRFDFDQICFNVDSIKEIKLYVEDLIENHYLMQLEFSIENDIVTITGNKALQFVEVTNE